MPTIRVGTSGWSYNHWQGIVYPDGAPMRERLEWYVKRFDTVEVNATYYHWQKASVFSGWRERLPENFLLTGTAPNALTHSARRLHPETWVERVKGGLMQLGEKRGVFLV